MEIETEAKFVEQEHRLLRIVGNVIEFRSAQPNDPRKKAALKALAWRLFSPASVAAAGLGGAALASLLVAIYTTILLQQQNAKLDQQTHLAEAARTAAMASELGAVIGAINEVSASTCLSANKDARFESLKCWSDLRDSTPEAKVHWLDVWLKSSDEKNAHQTQSLRRSLPMIVNNGEDSRHASLPLPPALIGRVQALSNALRPYRFVQAESQRSNPIPPRTRVEQWASDLGILPLGGAPVLVDSPLSVERGILLTTLMDNSIAIDEPEFSGVDLRYAYAPERSFRSRSFNLLDLSHGDFTCTSFANTYLENTKFHGANLTRAMFVNADVSGASFDQADLHEATFEGAKLPPPDAFDQADLTDTDFQGAFVSEPDWLDVLRQRYSSRVKGFRFEDWRVASLAGGVRETFKLERRSPALYKLSCRMSTLEMPRSDLKLP